MLNLTNTISWDDICLIDCETRAPEGEGSEVWGDVTVCGADRYAERAYPILITWGFGDQGDVEVWESPDVTRPPTLDELPRELLKWSGYFMAANSGFDRRILDPIFKRGVNRWLDLFVQCAYNNMPLALDLASKDVGGSGKVAQGKSLIRLFCPPGGATPQQAPEKWAQFVEYAKVDVTTMQEVIAGSLPVPFSIWEDFWVSERINDRGIPTDVAYAAKAAVLADVYAEQTNDRVSEITDGFMYSIRQYQKQAAWVWERIGDNPFVREHMIKAQRQNPETGEDEFKFQMDRPAITKMIAALDTLDEEKGLTDDEYQALQFLDEREFGASAAPAKLQKMVNTTSADGYRRGVYIFRGAAQTGRFSSYGVQDHNMTNRAIGSPDKEEAALNDILDGIQLPEFEKKYGNAGRALSLLVRPAITAPEGEALIWGDWSNIEARGLPWLAGAEHRLDIFRAIDAAPKETPDVYLQAVAGMYDMDPQQLLQGHLDKDPEVKQLRQRGKIAELSLGFNGGPGALQNMAAKYGMMFETSEAQEIVDRWRNANKWAVAYWAEVWDAFIMAKQNPGERYSAGRVSYEAFMVGSSQVWVACYLPDGSPLIYRNVRERTIEIMDDFEPDKVSRTETKLSFQSSKGWKSLWAGLLVENITQAACARVLTCTLRRLEQEPYASGFTAHGHTHDEILGVVPDDEERIRLGRDTLAQAMLCPEPWMDRLPLGVDIEDGYWYTKAEE